MTYNKQNMKSRIIAGYLLVCICCFSACVNKPGSNLGVSKDSGNDFYSESAIKFDSVQQNRYITVDTVKFLIPKDINLNPGNVYNGIYEIHGNSLRRYKCVKSGQHAFLTTFENLGQGARSHLYVFDAQHKSLIRDFEFNRNYLYSSAGIFIVDRSTHKIFSVDKPEWYDAKQELIIPASISYIKGDHFETLKNIYKVGNEVPGDTSLISFYKSSMSADNKNVLVLPANWWKMKQ